MILPNSKAVNISGALALPRRTDELSSATIGAAIAATNSQLTAAVDAHNALLGDLKTAGQLVTVNLPAVTLSAGDSIQLGNFRIPPGYVAAIVNAAIAASPVAGGAFLGVSYSAGTFGSTAVSPTASSVLATIAEFTGDGTKFATGEFIFEASNTSKSKLTITASVLLALY